MEIAVHLRGGKDVRAVGAKGLQRPIDQSAPRFEADSAVRCTEREEPIDELLAGGPIPALGVLLKGDLLEHASAHQSAHRVSKEVDPPGPRLPEHELHVLVEPDRRFLDIEVDRLLAECRGRGVVEAVHPNGASLDLSVAPRFQVRGLISLDEQLVVLVIDQPEQWALELVEAGVAISIRPHMCRAIVEPVERIVPLLVNSARPAGVTPHVDDRQHGWHGFPPLTRSLTRQLFLMEGFRSTCTSPPDHARLSKARSYGHLLTLWVSERPPPARLPNRLTGAALTFIEARVWGTE